MKALDPHLRVNHLKKDENKNYIAEIKSRKPYCKKIIEKYIINIKRSHIKKTNILAEN